MRHIFVRSLDGGRVRRRRGFAVREESTRASRGGVADVAIPARLIIRGQSSRARKSRTLTCSTHRTHRVTWARAPFSSRSRERRSSRARRPGRRDETTSPARAPAPASARASPPAPPRVRDHFHPLSAPPRRPASGQFTPRPRRPTRERNAHTQKRLPPARSRRRLHAPPRTRRVAREAHHARHPRRVHRIPSVPATFRALLNAACVERAPSSTARNAFASPSRAVQRADARPIASTLDEKNHKKYIPRRDRVRASRRASRATRDRDETIGCARADDVRPTDRPREKSRRGLASRATRARAKSRRRWVE